MTSDGIRAITLASTVERLLPQDVVPEYGGGEGTESSACTRLRVDTRPMKAMRQARSKAPDHNRFVLDFMSMKCGLSAFIIIQYILYMSIYIINRSISLGNRKG
jgi:hypothetical protein